MPPRDEKMQHFQPITDVDRIIHEPARYLIMAYLYVVESADFLFLLRQTELTKGNLSSHLGKLEKAGYVDIKKKFSGKIPQTLLKLTKDGRTAFDDYRSSMKKVLADLPERGK
jgi:DNA-binding MarR family transcriptional regulator